MAVSFSAYRGLGTKNGESAEQKSAVSCYGRYIGHSPLGRKGLKTAHLIKLSHPTWLTPSGRA